MTVYILQSSLFPLLKNYSIYVSFNFFSTKPPAKFYLCNCFLHIHAMLLLHIHFSSSLFPPTVPSDILFYALLNVFSKSTLVI